MDDINLESASQEEITAAQEAVAEAEAVLEIVEEAKVAAIKDAADATQKQWK